MAETQFQQNISGNKSKYETHLIYSYASRSNFKFFQHINSLTKSKSILSIVSGVASSKALVGHNLREVMGVLMLDGKIVHI